MRQNSTPRPVEYAVIVTWCLLGLLTLAKAQGYRKAVRYSLEPGGSKGVHNSILCAMKYAMLPHIGAIRLRRDGIGCEVLPPAWLHNRSYDNGFNYLVQERIEKVMTPPLRVTNPKLHLNIPGELENNSSLSVTLSAYRFTQNLVIRLKDKTDEVAAISMYIQGHKNISKVETKLTMLEPEFPFVNLNTVYTMTFDEVSTNHNIRIMINGVQWVSIPTTNNRLPLREVKLFVIGLRTGNSTEPLYVDQFVFDST